MWIKREVNIGIGRGGVKKVMASVDWRFKLSEESFQKGLGLWRFQ